MSLTEEILEHAAPYYERFFWERAEQVRVRIADEIAEETLRAFGVGYASERGHDAIDELTAAGYEPGELVAAGVARISERGRLHAFFHSRITFPLRDRAGRIDGFAAMATSPGPSWPLWVTSPESPHFRRRAAMFWIDRATAEIARSRRALVLADCLDVITLHQTGERDAVAVIRSPISDDHLGELAACMDLDPTRRRSSARCARRSAARSRWSAHAGAASRTPSRSSRGFPSLTAAVARTSRVGSCPTTSDR